MISLKSLTFVVVFFLLFLGYFHPISSMTQDLGRHLKTGEIILSTGNVPKINLFSYTYPYFPFINHHWFSEALYYTSFQVTGTNGLLILNTMLALLSFSLIYFFISKKSNAIVLLIGSLLYIPILFERTDVRPEFFSFLFLSFFIVILYKFREKFTYLIFLLPLIELIWVNTHIYFPIGIILLLFFTIDSFFKYKPLNSRYIGIFVVVLLGCIFVTLINPNGLKGALYPLSVFQNYGYAIEENQNIFFLWTLFHKQSINFFFIATLFLCISLISNFRKILPADWLISIFFTILAILSIRNFPLFVFATFIPFVKALSNFKLFTLNKQFKVVILVLLLSLTFFEAQQIVTKKGFGLGVEKGASEAADFFIKENLKGPIFNNFDIGSYLSYRLYPKEKVFVDGRPEAYPASFFKEEYIPMQEDTALFEKTDQKYKFNTVFFSHTDQTPWARNFIKQITKNNNWRLIYLDDFAAIWTKDKFIKSNIQTDYSDKKSLIQLAHFFQNTKYEDEEIKIYQKLLSLDPKSCPTLYNLALRLENKNDPSAPIFINNFQKNCQ